MAPRRAQLPESGLATIQPFCIRGVRPGIAHLYGLEIKINGFAVKIVLAVV